MKYEEFYESSCKKTTIGSDKKETVWSVETWSSKKDLQWESRERNFWRKEIENIEITEDEFRCQDKIKLSGRKQKKSKPIQKSRLGIITRNVKNACAAEKKVKII